MTGGEEDSHRNLDERRRERVRSQAEHSARHPTAASDRSVLATAAARILAKSIGMAQLYPAHHPNRAGPLRQFTGFLNRTLRDEGKIQVLIVGQRFLFNGALAPDASDAAVMIVSRFKGLRLRGFQVTQAASESASEALLDVLTLPTEQIERAGGPVMLLAQLDPQGAFTLLETDAAASVGQIAQAQETQIEAILSRYLHEDAPELTAEQIRIMRRLLGEPQLVALLLRTAAKLTDSAGRDEDAAGKLVEKVLLGLAAGAELDMRRLHETFAQAEADGLLEASNLTLPEPPPDIGATADAPAADREEQARQEMVHQLLTGREAASTTAPNPSLELLFAGDAGKRNLARMLYREMQRQQQGPEDLLRRSIMELLSAALPSITPDSRLARDLDELLQLVAELEDFDLQAGHAYALAELAQQATDPSARCNALDRLLPYIYAALLEGRPEQADNLVGALAELTAVSGAETEQIANHAAAKCEQIVSSEEFARFTQALEDRTILQSESVRSILARLGPWLTDWLVTRAAAASTNEQVKLALTNILTTLGDDRVGPALRAGMEQFDPARDSALLILLHRIDPAAFHRYCRQALEQAENPLPQLDVLALLDRVRDPETIGTLQPALQSHTQWLRIEALLCLGRIGSPNAAAILRRTAAQGDWLGRRHPLRRAAVSALGTLQDPEAVPVLTAILRKRLSLWPRRHRQLRQQAADALAAVGTEAAFAALRTIRSGRDRAAVRLAAAALAHRNREPATHERAETS